MRMHGAVGVALLAALVPACGDTSAVELPQPPVAATSPAVASPPVAATSPAVASPVVPEPTAEPAVVAPDCRDAVPRVAADGQVDTAGLDRLRDELLRATRWASAEGPPSPVAGVRVDPDLGRVVADVVTSDERALAAISARYGADRICFVALRPLAPLEPDGRIVPLAKVADWRDGLDVDAYALLEIADDAGTAERAWRENVPEDLPPIDLDGLAEAPAVPGRYGSVDEVDFSTHVVAVWSAVESGICPGWLADIEFSDGQFLYRPGWFTDGGCTADAHPYRMVLAVARDRVPGLADLPVRGYEMETTFQPHVLVRAYR